MCVMLAMRWLGGEVLCLRFSRLFGLAIDKNILVTDMHRIGWGVGGDGLRWRRCLLAREEELLKQYCAALDHFILQVVPTEVTAHKEVIWNKIAPLKALWIKILHWISVFGPLPNIIEEHALQFANFFLFRKDVDLVYT
ncbi:hypothetical protein A2U01_0005346 [Trifolium medium]|uniref:Uncharacterized protein n=1 Tax=Trifolium medium TaxID=97028 RepID=A0A392MDZ9_9FABA|nr:hypothetical protein [Trifolium medium]